MRRPVVGGDDDALRSGLGRAGRFLGITVIANSIAKSETMADANFVCRQNRR
jgi:hypothetical protein